MFVRLLLPSVTAFFFLYDFVYAQSGGTGGSPTTLANPLKSETISGFLLDVLDILLTFALPVIIFFIMYAGYKFVTAQGDTGQISEARSAFTWAVVGGVVVLGAKLLVDVIQGTVDAL